MPNQRDIRLLCKPLVDSRSDVICVNRYLLFVPLRSIFTSLYFARSAYRDDLDPTIMVRPLCCMQPDFPHIAAFPFMRPGAKTWRQAIGEEYVFNKELLDRIKPEPWLMGDPDYPDALREAIATEMLPQIASLANWQSALELDTRRYRPGDYHYERISLPYLIALGEFANAKALFDNEDPRRPLRKDFDQISSGLGDRLAEQGDKLSIDDKRALIAILHERERAAIHAMKLEKYWQPTPFPAEEQGLV